MSLAADRKSPEPGPADSATQQSAEQQRLNRYWSRWAGEYDAHQSRRMAQPGEQQTWERVWSAALPAAPADVLDLGTGSGHAAYTIASLGHRVTGIDLAEGMLEQARSKAARTGHAPEFRTADAADPPYPAECFDVLTARYVLWTIRHPDAALKRWHRLVRPGGRLIVVDSLWFPGGLHSPASAEDGETPTERSAHFDDAYAGSAEALPLAEARDVGAFAARIEAAGFTGVQIDELPEIMELDLAHGVAPGHTPQMQYRITAVRGV